jgi:hypothetical protein
VTGTEKIVKMIDQRIRELKLERKLKERAVFLSEMRRTKVRQLS